MVSTTRKIEKWPLVSVIIPVYNREAYIEQALDSVLNESYPNLELVVIDDGSTDLSKKIIEQWVACYQNRVSITFVSRENHGFISTLNELIGLAKGEYIVKFDSDDYLKNDGILKRYQYLQENPDKLMVIGDCILVDENGQEQYTSAYESIGKADRTLMQSDEGMQKFMLLNGYVPGCTLMARQRVYEKFGLYNLNYNADDWVYYVFVVAQNGLGYLNRTVSAYRLHSDNMCFSSHQLTVACEQLSVLFQLTGKYKGINQVYLIQRLLWQLCYIPYLAVKFFLTQQRENPVFGVLLKSLLTFKTLFNQVFDRTYARQGT